MPESEAAGAGCEPWESHGSATACGAAQSSKPDHLRWADMDSIDETTGSAMNWNSAADGGLQPDVAMDKPQTWNCRGSAQACDAGQGAKPPHLKWADMDSTESLDPGLTGLKEGRKRWATDSMESVEKRFRGSELLSKESYQEGPCSSEALVCDLTERFGLSADNAGLRTSQASATTPPVIEEPHRSDPTATYGAAHAEQSLNAVCDTSPVPTSPQGGPNDDPVAWQKRFKKRREAVAMYKASADYKQSLELRHTEGAGPAPRTPDFNNRDLVKRKWEDQHADWKHAIRRYIAESQPRPQSQ